MSLKESQANHWKKDKDLRIIKSYWTSPPATIRSKWFVEQLKKYEFESIFEAGYFSARNLKYIMDAFPNVSISGIEINPQAVKFAIEKLGLKTLHELNVHDLDSISGKHDIVFSSGMLIHIPPEDLRDVVEKMIRKANRYVMHIEQLGKSEVVAGPKSMNPIYKISGQVQWNCDLVSVYKSLGYDPMVIPLPDDCKTNGASELVIVEMKQ